MVSIHIDINTRVLPDDHRVFVVRPGANYRLYRDVVDKSAILYDMPGLQFPARGGFAQIENLSAQVQRSQAIRNWWKVGRHVGQAFPSRNLDDYPYPEARTEKRSLSQLTSIGSAYFEKARVGDMVIVPPHRFADPVMVGEIVDDDIFETTVVDYGDEPMFGRRVRWLAEISKNDVPARVIGISQKPNSFVQLERSVATWFYDRAYRSYLLAGNYQCELRVGAEKFGSTDDAKLSAFLNFVAANYGAVEMRRPAVPLSVAAFADLGLYEPDKRISINSPGEIIVHAARLSPLIFVVLLGLTGCAPAEVSAAVNDGLITIGNSAAGPGDQCAAEVYQSTMEWLMLVGADLWEVACPIAAQAMASAQVSIPAVVTMLP